MPGLVVLDLNLIGDGADCAGVVVRHGDGVAVIEATLCLEHGDQGIGGAFVGIPKRRRLRRFLNQPNARGVDEGGRGARIGRVGVGVARSADHHDREQGPDHYDDGEFGERKPASKLLPAECF